MGVNLSTFFLFAAAPAFFPALPSCGGAPVNWIMAIRIKKDLQDVTSFLKCCLLLCLSSPHPLDIAKSGPHDAHKPIV